MYTIIDHHKQIKKIIEAGADAKTSMEIYFQGEPSELVQWQPARCDTQAEDKLNRLLRHCVCLKRRLTPNARATSAERSANVTDAGGTLS